MKIIGIIPARFSSSRLAGKPLVDLCGKSMIERTYTGSQASKLLESVIVATDDERIYQEVKRFNGDVEMTSLDHQSGTDRIAEVAQKRGFADDDVIVNIQGDQPLIAASTIDSLIRPLTQDKSLVMSTMSYRITDPEEIDNPSIVKLITDLSGMALYFSRYAIPYVRDNQGIELLKVPYYKHLGLYAYRKKFLMEFSGLRKSYLEQNEKLEQLRVLENGYGIKVVESEIDSLEVDTPEDVEKVRQILADKRRR
jgi:3-deoxy-manno-octulosonate cytidylyltransferase (CMP-KDO synthetase)